MNFVTDYFFIVLKTWKLFVLKSDLRISIAEKNIRINRNEHHSEKRQYLPYYWSDKGFNGTVVNLALPSMHGESTWNYVYSPFNRCWHSLIEET